MVSTLRNLQLFKQDRHRMREVYLTTRVDNMMATCYFHGHVLGLIYLGGNKQNRKVGKGTGDIEVRNVA